ncbi:unnamed protein product [Paramecium sonneborni]|uniref:Uncharacterized protein n=1 Tax=Paramecium sonneborni TaxID=65129 RepID=A0A8S1LG11_9CILI|nr:unnamed protein product [Paramecium sonneborni]
MLKYIKKSCQGKTEQSYGINPKKEIGLHMEMSSKYKRQEWRCSFEN